MRNDSHSQSLSEQGRENYEKIFGKKPRKAFHRGKRTQKVYQIGNQSDGRIHDNCNLQSLALGQPDETKQPEEIERIRRERGIEVKFNPATGAMVLPNRAAQVKVAKYMGFTVD